MSRAWTGGIAVDSVEYPVIRSEIRKRLTALYSNVMPWSKVNNDVCHAAFLAMWAQYDHILPYAGGGKTHPGNMVIACAPCSFGRYFYVLEEVDCRILESGTRLSRHGMGSNGCCTTLRIARFWVWDTSRNRHALLREASPLRRYSQG
jgi:hypothetical protein